MSQTCGLCKLGLRSGENLGRIRITAEDMKHMKYPVSKEPGLYQACPECVATYLPVVAERLGRDPATVGGNDLI